MNVDAILSLSLHSLLVAGYMKQQIQIVPAAICLIILGAHMKAFLQ